MRAVLRVDVLDDPFAPITARQIEIDIRPFAAFFRQKALEEQFHAHRVDRRDAQAVTDGAVGGRPAPLHQDALLAAEIDDVPDDQEIAGQAEFLDEVEFAGDLRAGFVVEGPVPFAGTHERDGPQERRGRLAGRHGVIGKLIAEIVHGIVQTIRKVPGCLEGLGHVPEQRRHVVGRLQVPFSIPVQAAPRPVDRRPMAQARQHIEQRPVVDGREPDAVGGHHRNVKRRRQVAQHAVVEFFVTQVMALDFHAHPVAAERADQPIHQAADTMTAGPQRFAAADGRQAGGLAVQIVQRQRAFAFGRPQPHTRDEAAEITITLRRFDQDGQAPQAGGRGQGQGTRDRGQGRLRVLTKIEALVGLAPCPLPLAPNRELAPDEGLEAGGAGGFVKPRRAVHAVPIEEGQRRVPERRRPLDERFRR